MKSLNEGFTKEYLSKLENVSLEIQKRIHNLSYNGARKSNTKGSSIEFSDFRNYSIGDDLRRIDWNSYARFDRLFMKLFTEEKQASIHLFLDCSASMNEEKQWYSKMLAASLAYISLKNMDRVNLFICGKSMKANKLNLQSKNSFLDIIHFLDSVSTSGETNLYESIKESMKLPIGEGISVILSDFFTKGSYKEAVKLLQSKRQTIILIQVLSKEEEEPSLRGAVQLLDIESREVKEIEVSQEILREYKKALKNYKNELKEFSKTRGIQFIDVSTDSPLLKTMNRLL